MIARGAWVSAVGRATVVLTSLTVAAMGQDNVRLGAESVREGNRLLAETKYAEALAAYDRAAEQLPNSAAVAYDRGIALYRLGKFDDAERALQDALAGGDRELEARIKYNLGRSAHEAALGKRDKLEEAIHDLSRAIRFYEDALQSAPDDADARTNKDIAERLRVFLEKKREEQKKEPPTSQPSSQPQDQPSSQPQEQPTSQPQQSAASQSSSQPDESRQGQGEHGEQQEEGQEDQAKQKDETAKSQERKAGKEGQGEEGREEKAKESAGEKERSGDEDQRKRSVEEVEPMLQEARDMERQRREARRQQAIRIRGQVPVKRDW
jgi:Ca-activated chloride channel family protein